MKFNTPETSSARSERLFSGGKLVLETKCNHLDDENFEKLLLLNFNKNLYGAIHKRRLLRGGGEGSTLAADLLHKPI